MDFSDALIKEYMSNDNDVEYYIVKVHGDGDSGDVYYLGTDEEAAIQAVDNCYPDWLRYGMGGGDSAPAVYKYFGTDKTFIDAVLNNDEAAAITFFYNHEDDFKEIYIGDMEGSIGPDSLEDIPELQHIIEIAKAAGCADIEIIDGPGDDEDSDETVYVKIKDIYKLAPDKLDKEMILTLMAGDNYYYNGAIYGDIEILDISTEGDFNDFDFLDCTKQELVDKLLEAQNIIYN